MTYLSRSPWIGLCLPTISISFHVGHFSPALSLAFAYIKHFTIEKCTGRFLFMWKRFEAASLFNDSIYIIFLFNFRPASDKTDSLLHSQTFIFALPLLFWLSAGASFDFDRPIYCAYSISYPNPSYTIKMIIQMNS